MTPNPNKRSLYQEALSETLALITPNQSFITNLSLITAVIQSQFSFHWVGFYLIDESQNQLVLGPFQGPVACTHIAYGRGVCGTSWKENKTLVVNNVHKFAGHIACSALSNSEIVVPLVIQQKVVAVLDIDSTDYNSFDSIDVEFLEQMMAHLATCLTHQWPTLTFQQDENNVRAL